MSEDAERAESLLRGIRKAMRDSVWAEGGDLQVSLTAPQVQALSVLVDDLRADGSGLSLSELSTRMGLAHSTVSGIVTRLEQRGLLHRAEHPGDRRYLRIQLAAPVREWVARDLPAARLRPLDAAFEQATEEERAVILAGLTTLGRLLGLDGLGG
jgi:MarR family transcriptional regulator, organic hydroperoxide resistance regulator